MLRNLTKLPAVLLISGVVLGVSVAAHAAVSSVHRKSASPTRQIIVNKSVVQEDNGAAMTEVINAIATDTAAVKKVNRVDMGSKNQSKTVKKTDKTPAKATKKPVKTVGKVEKKSAK